jgi:hypothetical protein
MGQVLLANQFVAGLHPELKSKLMGVDGTLEELVLKARFKEVKGQEFAGTPRGMYSPTEPPPRPKGSSKKSEKSETITTTGDQPTTSEEMIIYEESPTHLRPSEDNAIIVGWNVIWRGSAPF